MDTIMMAQATKWVCRKNLWNKKTQKSTARNMTVTATAKAMVVRLTKDDKAGVMTTMTTTTLMTTTTNKMTENNDDDDDEMTR
jgi:hypothetical protein